MFNDIFFYKKRSKDKTPFMCTFLILPYIWPVNCHSNPLHLSAQVYMQSLKNLYTFYIPFSWNIYSMG